MSCPWEYDKGHRVLLLKQKEPRRSAGPATAEPQTCSGRDGDGPCGSTSLPNRSVCGVHRVQELAGKVA
ncbi:hypothetical protein [Streptomyces canus]|uniref:hypothetical protein n=1 Tax=Streptomyces canus TaxID=58343 RepID=UPI002DDBF1BF|nr:hypothetical protein [Streptomyces canus]WSD82991.1 hypothetical protein OG925_00850 [Streptomyces canus]WSD91842.1 hypothetical protein OG925_49630 [Streptomyces canus]WSD92666.1 hypothetical protein OG925_51330 [Streptomyces canus]